MTWLRRTSCAFWRLGRAAEIAGSASYGGGRAATYSKKQKRQMVEPSKIVVVRVSVANARVNSMAICLSNC